MAMAISTSDSISARSHQLEDHTSAFVDYYANDRSEMLQFLPPHVQRLIDIGCGEGLFGEAVKRRFPNCETWGLEPIKDAADQASRRNDCVICAPLGSSAQIPLASFDVVTMNDVLEHLQWPEPALSAARQLLRPNGKLILSLPNVQFLPNILKLVVENDWEYQDFGVLDRTHFRFFTTKSATRLLEANGYQVESISGINQIRPRWYFRLPISLAPRYFRWLPFQQFAIVASPIASEN
jgi:2-polyprenyl-3-methyl-5-hydroxy-6-metoxy-1,4-benzoquinol methylase